jgi:predicted oxidoreductase
MTVPRLMMTGVGPDFSRIAFGFWRLLEWDLRGQDLLNLIEALLDRGITTLDHADLYGGYACEAVFGEALALNPGLRSRMEIVTKCGIKYPTPARPTYQQKAYDTSRDHILASVEQSLQNFRTDYLDLLLIHRPDPLMDADEVAAVFNSLYDAGKVRYFGVSNFTPSQFALLQSRLDVPLVTNQIEFSVLHPEPMFDGTLDQLQQRRVAPQAWSPYAGGRIFNGQDAQAQRVRDALAALSAKYNDAAPDHLALAWLLAHPTRVQPVLGTGKLARVDSALKALDITLERDDWFALLEASQGAPVP